MLYLILQSAALSGQHVFSAVGAEPALQLQRRYLKTKTVPPSRWAGVKRRKLLFRTKNGEAWSLFFSNDGHTDHLQAPMAHPGPPGRGRFESSITGAEAPAYF